MIILPRRKKTRKKPESAVPHAHLTKKEYFKRRFVGATEHYDGMFASDFVKLFIEKDSAGMSLSESGVYKYLKEFTEEGILYKTKRKYYATEKWKAKFALEQVYADLQNLPEWMFDLGREVLEAANQQIREESKSIKRVNPTIKLWGKWISAITLYCLGKEIETGQSFWFVLANYLTYVGGAHAFLLRHIIYRATPNIEIKELIKLGRKGVAFGEKEAYVEEVASYFKNLRQSYPVQIGILKRIFQKEGIASHLEELKPISAEESDALERFVSHVRKSKNEV